MTDRRRFLSLLGIGAASAPLAAKEMMDKSIGDLVIRGEESMPLAMGAARVHEHHGKEEDNFQKAVDYLLRNGLPNYVDEQLREDSKFVMALDPDIASKRSWSMAVKIQEQRQRNYENKKTSMLGTAQKRKEKRGWQEAIGFKWPWYI